MRNLKIFVSLALIIAMTPLISAQVPANNPQTQNITASEKSTSYKTSLTSSLS